MVLSANQISSSRASANRRATSKYQLEISSKRLTILPSIVVGRQREILWFNPPYSKNVKSKIGHEFLKLVDKHFGNEGNILKKIFNRNKIKVSYGCTKNIDQIIKSHNKDILNRNNHNSQKCNCQRKQECPLNGNCMVENVVYTAHVTTLGPNTNQTPDNTQPLTTNQSNQPNHNYSLRRRENVGTAIENEDHPPPITNRDTPNTERSTPNTTMTYIGAAENFKMRYRNHIKSFRNSRYKKETELSKYIHMLNENNTNFLITWKILRKTTGYNQVTKMCNLCTSEKVEIIKFKNKKHLLNKRTELISKCRHENKYLLANLVTS